MFTCNFCFLLWKGKKAEGLKSFVTVISTFEMLLLNTNPHAVIQTTSPLRYNIRLLRDYVTAVRIISIYPAYEDWEIVATQCCEIAICNLIPYLHFDNTTRNWHILVKNSLMLFIGLFQKTGCREYLSHEHTDILTIALNYHTSETSIPAVPATVI